MVIHKICWHRCISLCCQSYISLFENSLWYRGILRQAHWAGSTASSNMTYIPQNMCITITIDSTDPKQYRSSSSTYTTVRSSSCSTETLHSSVLTHRYRSGCSRRYTAAYSAKQFLKKYYIYFVQDSLLFSRTLHKYIWLQIGHNAN